MVTFMLLVIGALGFGLLLVLALVAGIVKLAFRVALFPVFLAGGVLKLLVIPVAAIAGIVLLAVVAPVLLVLGLFVALPVAAIAGVARLVAA